MNTNEASLGRTTVQTYSSREKRAFDGVLFSMECTARWLENACDQMQAASEIRLAMAELRNRIADCEVIADAGSESGPPNGAMRKDAVTREQVIEWGKLAGFETSLQRERNLERLGDFAIFARMDYAKRAALPAEKVAAEPIYQTGNENGHVWRDVTPLDYARADAHKRIVFSALQPAQTQVALTLSLDQLAAVRAAANLAESMGSVVISTDLRSILTASQPASGADHD